MTSRKAYLLKVIGDITGDFEMADQIVEHLTDEGFLHLGYGDKDVDQILDKFKTTFGNTKTTQYDRFAAHRLAEKYSAQAIMGIIELLGSKITEKYAPVPSSVANMEEKIVSILAFLRKTGESEVI